MNTKSTVTSRTASVMLSGVVAVMLAGCTAEENDLRQELTSLTQNVKGKIPPLPEVKAYTPFPYVVDAQMDPFGPTKALTATKSPTQSANAPDLKRPREPLESYPVETMKFSGTVVQKGVVHALITADGNLHSIKLGNYVGQNFGKVVKIAEDEVTLRELVQDAAGEWVERSTSLSLQGQ